MATKKIIKSAELKIKARADFAALLFVYSTKHLDSKDKVRFFYAFKGRDGKSGIIKELGCEFLAKGVILVPLGQAAEMKSFFEYWSCPYTIRGKLKDAGQI